MRDETRCASGELVLLLIDEHRPHDDGADDDLLDVVGHPEHVARIAEHGHDERPHDGAEGAPLPPVEPATPIST